MRTVEGGDLAKENVLSARTLLSQGIRYPLPEIPISSSLPHVWSLEIQRAPRWDYGIRASGMMMRVQMSRPLKYTINKSRAQEGVR